MSWSAALALGIFAVTLALVVWRPRGLGVGWPALGGAVATVATGLVGVRELPEVVSIVGNATVAFIAIVLISLILDRAGLFTWAALHAARLGRGSPWRLFLLVIALGSIVSILFANDGAALILTPIVVGIVLELGMDAAATLAFVMACGFIADTASLPLVISNLVNIIAADRFSLSFLGYAQVMAPVGAVAILASTLVLCLRFGRDLPASYDVAAVRSPASAIIDPLTARAGIPVLGALLIGYAVAGSNGVPLGLVAAVGAAVLLVVAAIGRRIPLQETIRSAPWQIIVFSAGMYVVVFALRNEGMVDLFAAALTQLGSHGVLGAALGTGILVALLASVMNNLPAILLAVLAVEAAGVGGSVGQAMIHASVIGADLGPKFTPIGSLATLLWLHVLAGRGITITWGQYLRTGIVLTAPVLVITLAALAGVILALG